MKINVFNIKFKTNPNKPIAMTKDPFVLEVPDDADVNSYIAERFTVNYGAVPTFEWELLDDVEWEPREDDDDDNTLDDRYPSVNDFAEEIRHVLRRYFEANDNGDPNPEYDENFEPQAAIDAIHEIVGKI